jgi:hypothetical protein
MRTIIPRRCRMPVVYILSLFLFGLPVIKDSHASEPDSGASSGQPSSGAGESLPTALANDGSYFLHSLYSDGIDLLKLPLRANEATLTGVLVATAIIGTIPAAIYGLDDPLRRNVKNIPDSTAGDLTTIGQTTTFGSLGLIYGWGLYSHNDEARHAMITGAEGIGVSALLTVGIKAAFGRKRPKTDEGPKAFFQGGQSFISGDATPTFAAAATISEALIIIGGRRSRLTAWQ